VLAPKSRELFGLGFQPFSEFLEFFTNGSGHATEESIGVLVKFNYLIKAREIHPIILKYEKGSFWNMRINHYDIWNMIK
jgi:hypothetical protein